jgi:hypothetical protein
VTSADQNGARRTSVASFRENRAYWAVPLVLSLLWALLLVPATDVAPPFSY